MEALHMENVGVRIVYFPVEAWRQEDIARLRIGWNTTNPHARDGFLPRQFARRISCENGHRMASRRDSATDLKRMHLDPANERRKLVSDQGNPKSRRGRPFNSLVRPQIANAT
jgi:hypothetical protein